MIVTPINADRFSAAMKTLARFTGHPEDAAAATTPDHSIAQFQFTDRGLYVSASDRYTLAVAHIPYGSPNPEDLRAAEALPSIITVPLGDLTSLAVSRRDTLVIGVDREGDGALSMTVTSLTDPSRTRTVRCGSRQGGPDYRAILLEAAATKAREGDPVVSLRALTWAKDAAAHLDCFTPVRIVSRAERVVFAVDDWLFVTAAQSRTSTRRLLDEQDQALATMRTAAPVKKVTK